MVVTAGSGRIFVKVKRSPKENSPSAGEPDFMNLMPNPTPTRCVPFTKSLDGFLEEKWMFARFVGKMQMVKKEMAGGEVRSEKWRFLRQSHCRV